MKNVKTQYEERNRHSPILRTVIAATLIALTLGYQAAYAETLRASAIRVTVGSDKFADTWQSAVIFDLPAPRRLRAHRIELASGVLSTSRESRPLISLGPVWRVPITTRRVFLEIGISPTLLFGSNFNDRDLGGNFHFTSSATIGTTIGARDASSISLRIQHTSNAGLNSLNPGMDMIGVNFAFDFDQ